MKRWLICFLALAILGVALYGIGKSNPTDLQTAMQRGELVRIHILAQDDTAEQQAIKLYVRDAILEYFTPLLQEVSSGREAAEIVRTHLKQALETAKAAAAEKGFTKEIRAEFGVFPFPERTYGDQVVPAGEYQALRILLGDAKGKNWWCVMYPPLCFSGEEYEGQVKFESGLAKWFKKIKKEIQDGKKPEDAADVAAGTVSCDAADTNSAGRGRVLGKQG